MYPTKQKIITVMITHSHACATGKVQTAAINSNVNDNLTCLSHRGIAPSVLQQFHVSAQIWHNKQGYAYPATDPISGGNGQRWKALQSDQTPKYAWIGGKPPNTTYYGQNSLKTALSAAEGVLYLAAGEVDLWTFHSAGLTNVISLYGEGHVPASLATDLHNLGVNVLIYLPDRDEAGHRSAIKVRDTLAGSGIHYEARELPKTVGDKGDTNDLWQLLQFDASAFKWAIDTAPPLELPARQIPTVQARKYTHTDTTDRYTRWVGDIVKPALDAAAPIVRGYRGDGWRHSPDPTRTDKHPSFRVSYDKHDLGVPMDAFGAVDGGWTTVGNWLGVPDFKTWVQDTYPTQAPPMPSRQNTDPTSEDSAPISKPAYDFTPDVVLNTRYVSQMPIEQFSKRGAYVVTSPQDTGKTALLERLMDGWRVAGKVVRFVTPLNTLTDELARRMNCESQLALYPDQQSLPDAIAVTLPSLVHQVNSNTGELRRIDVLVLDEIEQTLATLFADIYKTERMSIYNTLVEAIRCAETVICLDADASAVTYNFLRGIRDDVTFIVNEYRNYDRQLRSYDERTALIHALDEQVANQQSVIAVACSSEKQAHQLAKRYSKRNDKRIMLVCQSTKHNPDVKAFLRHPDEKASDYDLVIYTSAMGTGIDISTTRSEAVFGFFGRMPLTAWDMHQMLVRFRRAQVYNVWVDKTKMTVETDENKIYNTLLEREKRTKQLIMFSGGVNIAQQARLALARLRAEVEARGNRSRHNLRSHFFAIAKERFTIIGEGDAISAPHQKQIKSELRDASKAIKAERAEDIISSTPVKTSTYKKAAASGKLTTELENGHRRAIIEEIYAEQISEELVKEYADGKGVRRLLLFESLYNPDKKAVYRDWQELERGVPLGDMTHATARRRLTLLMLKPFINDDYSVSTEPITLDELNEQVGKVIAEHERDIRRYFRWRKDYSEEPINLLRFMLNECGLKLERHRRGDGIKRYKLSAKRLETMRRYVEQRRQQSELPKSGEEISLQ